MQRAHIIVTGRVQGVGFRYFISYHANRLGLRGYVKNLDEDKVEIVVEGEEEKIKEIVTLSSKGPPLSIVLKQDVNFSEATKEFSDFRLRH